MARAEFVKDNYFKIDVECHLSGEIKKYFNYFPEYRMWWHGTEDTAGAFGAAPKKPAKDPARRYQSRKIRNS